MSDAIEARLRRMNDELLMVGNDSRNVYYSDVLLDAASEIEALRAQLDIAQKSGGMWFRATQSWGESCLALVAKLADCELATLRQRAERAEAERDEANHCASETKHDMLLLKAATAERDELAKYAALKLPDLAKLVAAQSTIAQLFHEGHFPELNATAERMRLLLLVLLREASCKVLHENGDAHHIEGLCPAIERFRAAMGEP